VFACASWRALGGGLYAPVRYFSPSSGPIAMSIFGVEWLYAQERFNPEVAITLGAEARYCRATVGSSHGDARPDNSTLHTGAVRPHTGFVGGLFSKWPRTIHPCISKYIFLESPI
jgi:hypothetical protein